MPNTISAFLPHSPLLIKEIGKNNTEILTETLKAYKYIKNLIKELEVDNIIIISQNESNLKSNFSLGVSTEFAISFKDFACFKKRENLKPALLLIDSLAQATDCQLITKKELDHNQAIPLELLIDDKKKIKILPILANKNLDWSDYYTFGEKLGEFINSQSEKIAVIASGNLSHCLKINSPGGFSPKAVRFDNKIIASLNETEKVKDKLLKINKENIKEVKERGLISLLIILGSINSDYQAKKLAYQTDFGVGYLSFLFNKKA
jgi:MEMO1 family protein